MKKEVLPIPPEVEAVGYRCIGCGITVSKELGPGFREIIYAQAFGLELDACGLKFEREKAIVVKYKQWEIPGQRIDLIVEDCVIIEIKSVSQLLPLHKDQLLSYLRTTGLRLGYVMNFNSSRLVDSMERVVL